MKWNQLKSKLFNLLLITTFALPPTVFFQYSCSKKKEKDDKLFEKEIYGLKEKIKNLEKIKSTLSFQLKPFNNLMTKYKVNNYEDLMKHLTDLDDPILQKMALLLANCLLETKTMIVSELRKKLNDKEWKNKNKKILESLLEPLQLKSLDDFVPNFSIDNKVKVLAENISKIKGSNFIKDLENDIDKTKEKLVENKNELIPFYLWQLHNGNYQDWGSFATKFNDESWKNQEKNKSIVGKLATILQCSFTDVNQQKIEDLKQHENTVLQLVKNQEQTNNELQKRISDLERDKKVVMDQIMQLNVVFALSQLYDDTYTDWDSFMEKFNDENWRNDEKNQPIVTKLMQLFNCQVHEISNHINTLPQQIKQQIEQLLQNKQHATNEIIELKNKLESNKNELVPFYLWQLHNGNYQDWNSFATKFNDESWKNQEKNKSIVGKLAIVLQCSFTDVNQQKIEDLKQHENTVLQLVKNQEPTNNELQQKKIDELEQTNNELQQRIDNLEQQKKTVEQVKDLDLLSQTNNELQKRISDLERDKNMAMNQIAQLKVPFALLQLYDDTYTDWDSFMEKFKGENWRNDEKNQPIIKQLCDLLSCQEHEIYDKINALPQQVKEHAKTLLENKHHDAKTIKQLENDKNQKMDQIMQLNVVFALSQLYADTYTNWDSFVEKFNDESWRNDEKNQPIVTKLMQLFNCQVHEISNHINTLPQQIKQQIEQLLQNKQHTSSKIIELENKLESNKNELIPFYLWQLHNGNYQDWNSFATKFNDESWKNQEKNKSIVGKLATILQCSFTDVNQQKIEDLKQHENTVLQLVKNQEPTNNELQQKKIDELEQTNKGLQQRINNLEQQKKTTEQIKDLDTLLQTNNLKDYDDLKDKFKKLDAVYKRISLIHDFITDLIGIYGALSDVSLIDIKTTTDQISLAIKNNELLGQQKKTMTFLYNTMLRLGVSDIDKLFQKLNNWLELLEYINGEKLDSLGSLIEECSNFKKWTENNEKSVQDEIFNAIQKTSLLDSYAK